MLKLVKAGDQLTANIPTPGGIRQGDIPSPLPFNFLIDKIINKVTDLNLGYKLGNKRNRGPKGPCSLASWRKLWDSNPRRACTLASFQDWCLKPLGHLSGKAGRSVVRGSVHGHPTRVSRLRRCLMRAAPVCALRRRAGIRSACTA